MDPNTTSLVLNGALNATLNQPYPIFLNATLNQPPQDWQNWLKDWLPLFILAFTAFLSLAVWGLTEWAKRSNQRREIKEERYLELIDLIENLKGNEKPGDPERKNKFIHQINLCWLYCSDDVLRKAIDLVSKFNDDGVLKDDREETFGELMIALRKDVQPMLLNELWNEMPWKATKLNVADYKKVSRSMLRRFVLRAESGKFEIKGEKAELIHKDKNGNIIQSPYQEER